MCRLCTVQACVLDLFRETERETKKNISHKHKKPTKYKILVRKKYVN